MTEQTQIPVGDQPAATKPVAPPFPVMRTLSTAFHVAEKNFIPFFVLACVLSVPSLLLAASSAAQDFLLVMLISTLTNALASAVVAYGVIMELYGSRPSVRVCMMTGLAQLGRVLGVTLISTLAIGAASLLLIVPGIVVSLMLYVVVPVTIVERLGIDAAMKRSRELTYGHKGSLFVIVLFGGLIAGAIELVALYALEPAAAFVWRALTQAALTMFMSVTIAVVYVELRKLRDGIRIPEIATALARIRK